MSKLSTIVRTISKHDNKLSFLVYRNIMQSPLSRIVSDKTHLSVLYYLCYGKKINWNHPTTFNEKMQWLKLYDKKEKYSMLADKYEVKEEVARIIGEDHIIPTIKVWNNFDEIDLNDLPNSFVLKCTHDSGGTYFCKSKEQYNISESRKLIGKNLKKNYYLFGREWPYKNIKPRIIAEPILQPHDGILNDYKFFCFNGKPRICLVCSDRYSSNGLHEDFYDMQWNHLDIMRPNIPWSESNVVPPMHFQEMVSFSQILSNGIPFARIDFYECNDCVYFGEYTFYPAGGFEKFYPEKWDEILGSWIDLPI